MAIENRNLAAREILVATFKKTEHRMLVVGDSELGLGFELDGDTIYKSLSSAGSAVMGGTACNGWRFWTRESERTAEPETATVMPEKPTRVTKLRPCGSSAR